MSSKWFQKGLQGSTIAPKSVLEGSGGHLGLKSQQEPEKARSSPLVPPLLGAKMEAKTHPKAVRSRSKNQWFFALLFIWLRDRFWEQIWRVLGVKLRAMLTKIAIIWPLVGKLVEIAKIWKNHWFLQCIWLLGLLNIHPKSSKNRPKVDQKSIKKWMEVGMSIFIDFLSILNKFWFDFAAQDGSKNQQKPVQKAIGK